MSDKAGKTLAKVIENAIRSRMLDLRVCLPARLESYDASKQKASVKPLLNKAYIPRQNAADTGSTELPVITDVPVQWPAAAAGTAYLHLPAAKGDLGMLVFCDRALDGWLAGNGRIAAPDNARIHDLKDPIFIPGLQPFGRPLANTSSANAVLQNGPMRVEMAPDGKISIEGASEEFLTIVDSVLDHLIQARVLTGVGGAPFIASTIAAFQDDKARLATIKRI